MKYTITTEVEIKIYAVSWVDKYTHGSKPIGYFTEYNKAFIYMKSVAKFWNEKPDALEIEEIEINPEPLKFD